MFQYLKRRLGIDDLEKQIRLYDNPWTEVWNCLAEMSERLKRIDVNVKDHAADGFNRYTEIMARLGMILTALEKGMPKEPRSCKRAKKGKNKDE